MRSILFSSPMVRAEREDRKTQTRRVLKHQADKIDGPNHDGIWSITKDPVTTYFGCPYGKIGDQLFVKEAAWMWCEKVPNGKTAKGNAKFRYVPLRSAPVHYVADHPTKPTIDVVSPDTGNKFLWRYKVGRYLPKWASRTTLEITNIRVERVQDISEADAMAEGVNWQDFAGLASKTARKLFRELWEFIHGEGSWDLNFFVWVISFKRVSA